jgi:hypothetical protein
MKGTPMADELSFTVRVKNMVGAGLASAGSALNSFKSRVSSGFASMKSSVGGWIAGVAGAAAVLGLFKTALSQAFEFEKYVSQFKVLFGSLEKAKAHMQDLEAFKGKKLFGLDGIAEASKAMFVMTDGVLGVGNSLQLVADVAAATGKPIEEVGDAVAFAYTQIANGEPVSRAAMSLQKMGVISGDLRARLQDMQEAGATNAQMWGVLRGALETYSGGVDNALKTGDGLMTSLKETWSDTLQNVGTKFEDLAKDKISGLIDWLNDLSESSALETWADRIVKALGYVADAAGLVINAVGAVGNVVEGLSAGAGSMSAGGTFKEGMDSAIKRQLDAEAEDAAKKRVRELQKTDATMILPEIKYNKLKAGPIPAEEKAALERLAKEDSAKVATAYAEAKRGLRADERDAAALGVKAFEFELKPGETSIAGKKRLETGIQDWKDSLDKAKGDAAKAKEKARELEETAKEISALEKQVRDAEGQAENDKWSKRQAAAEKNSATWDAAADRAQARRLMSTKEKRKAEYDMRKKTSKGAFTEEELDALRERQKTVNDLTKEETRALKTAERKNPMTDKKSWDRLKALREKQAAGKPLTAREKELLAQGNAQVEGAWAKDAAKGAKEKLEEQNAKNLKESAADLKVIKQKLTTLLQVK